jgi:hypothetical protein
MPSGRGFSFLITGFMSPFRQCSTHFVEASRGCSETEILEQPQYTMVLEQKQLPESFNQDEQSHFLKLFNTGPQFFPCTSSRNINFYIKTLLECKDMEASLQTSLLPFFVSIY